MSEIKPLALYLPQYHPIKENDEWWGKGFTEWTNVGKAKPLYKGHQQPKLPTDLGYYDLRVPEVRAQQAKMAREYGIYGFIYYHYWFGNSKLLLETIAEEVLRTKEPDFPFCFCWANETWSGIWHGLENKVLAQQVYPGREDIIKHLEYLIPFFKDERYIKVDGKPLLMIYEPLKMDNVKEYLALYREIALELDLSGLYLVCSSKGNDNLKYSEMGFDANVSNAYHAAFDTEVNNWRKKNAPSLLQRVINKIFKIKHKEKGPIRVNADIIFSNTTFKETDVETYPMIVPNWDNTPRSGRRGVVMENTSPESFSKEVKKAKKFLDNSHNKENFLIIKSWNEWAEGNILEPDREHSYDYLNALNNALKDNK